MLPELDFFHPVNLDPDFTREVVFDKSVINYQSMTEYLCVNYEKHGIENYIGGSTFIEIYEAFKNNKKIFLFHDIPKGMLYDEIAGFDPIVLNEDLSIVDNYR